jgi:hypothetical protein
MKTYTYLYPQTSGKKVIRYHSMTVAEIEPLSLHARVVSKPLNGSIPEKNCCNAGYFWTYKGTTYSLSHLASGGKNLAQNVPHGKPTGTLLVYKDGRVEIKAIDKLPPQNELQFAVGGLTILPMIDNIKEGFVGAYTDVMRETKRVVLGYNPTKRKIILVGYKSMSAARGRDALKYLGCTQGITLDAGGSSLLKINDKTILRPDSRIQFGLIYWEA